MTHAAKSRNPFHSTHLWAFSWNGGRRQSVSSKHSRTAASSWLPVHNRKDFFQRHPMSYLPHK